MPPILTGPIVFPQTSSPQPLLLLSTTNPTSQTLVLLPRMFLETQPHIQSQSRARSFESCFILLRQSNPTIARPLPCQPTPRDRLEPSQVPVHQIISAMYNN